ncbi:MAG: protein kinase [Chthoniobacteraceae bacterium]
MADTSKPAIQECPTCGTLIDVTDEQPLALRHCPNCGAAMRVRRIFNHFELQEVLGSGGMGAVYRALDQNLNRAVALKLLREEHSKSPDLIDSFAKEAAITASISHPHVVKVYSTGIDHGIFYIAMELVDKGSLEELITLQGKVAEAQVLEVGIQIAQGLNAAYQRGLIHRDVKPGNILFADAHNAKIVDFGLAVLQEHANKEGAAIWGTPYYVAPEKLDTPPHEDFRSDMYSLGATLFHAAAGRPPFEAETASMVTLKHLKSQVVSLQAFAPEVSSATAFVINKTLHKEPDERYASYEELIEHLQYAQSELLGLHQAKARKPIVVVDENKGMGWVTLATAAVVVAAGVTAFTYRDSLFGGKSRADATPSAHTAGPVFDAAYQKAREQLAAGQYDEAAAALRALDAQDVAPQPLKNWITVNAALAFLLQNQPDEARKEFEKVEARGIYSPEPTEQKIATFFVDMAQAARSDTPRPAALVKTYDLANHEAFALLLFGAKDWAQGAFADAAPFFEQFQTATPGEALAWLNAYKPLAANYTAGFASMQSLTKIAGNGGGLETLQQALENAKTTREKLSRPGKFKERITELEDSLTKKLAAAQEAKAMKDAEEDTAEEKALAATLAGVNAAYTAFKFTDAARLLANTRVTNEKRKEERDAWAKRTEWLSRFKATVISDINATGYAQPLRRRNGTPIQFGLRQASDATATMVTPYGNVPVPWTDLSVESLTIIAQSFLRTAPPETAADRQWQLGVFLYSFEKKPEGRVMLNQAAESKPDYQPFLALFPET